MKDLNSAAQVSTFLNTGKTLRAILFDLTTFSLNPEILASFLSENPIDLTLLNSSKFRGRPYFLIKLSSSTSSLIWFRNQGSTLDSLYILSKVIFF